ncbi:hypothetical protein TorRG33x02_261690, partial [Trema orientale]
NSDIMLLDPQDAIGQSFGGSETNSTPSIAHLGKTNFSTELQINEQTSPLNS